MPEIMPTIKDFELRSKELEIQAKQKKEEAVHLMHGLLRIPEGFCSSSIREFVDAILAASSLEKDSKMLAGIAQGMNEPVPIIGTWR